MLLAKAVSPLKAVAKTILAPGARSWTIWAIARPSSVVSVAKESSRTLNGSVKPQGLPAPGRSPLAMSVAARVAAVGSVSKESERMPTVTPLPSTPKSARASAAASWVSPSESIEPQAPEVNGVGTGFAFSTPSTEPSRSSSPGLAATVTVW